VRNYTVFQLPTFCETFLSKIVKIQVCTLELQLKILGDPFLWDTVFVCMCMTVSMVDVTVHICFCVTLGCSKTAIVIISAYDWCSSLLNLTAMLNHFGIIILLSSVGLRCPLAEPCARLYMQGLFVTNYPQLAGVYVLQTESPVEVTFSSHRVCIIPVFHDYSLPNLQVWWMQSVDDKNSRKYFTLSFYILPHNKCIKSHFLLSQIFPFGVWHMPAINVWLQSVM